MENNHQSAPPLNSDTYETGNPAPLREGDWDRILAVIDFMYIYREIPDVTS
jgi:hypothetical protein